MSEHFFIRGCSGEKALSGSIAVEPAKNAVLKMMAASILFSDPVAISPVPDIEDVHRMEELLERLGARITRDDAGITIDATAITSTELAVDIAERLRSSIVLTGPLLARHGEVSFPHPGGCVIGARPIDVFLHAFEKMGATVDESDRHYTITAPKGGLHGADIFFRVPSHTATETCMLAAVCATGTTTLHNAAMEPEVADLADFLNRSGAQISGVGTPTITIEGTGALSAGGAAYRPLPDRIETGSFLILGALAARELEITDCEPAHVGILIELLRDAGVPIEVGERTIAIRGNTKPNAAFSSVDIKTHEYPGFPTDLQAPMTVFLTQATGEAVVFEAIFEGRLNYTEDLIRMGADITMWDPHRVQVKGPTPLSGRNLGSPDLRAGLAFVIAAAVADGNSVIDNIYFIDRGYADIEKRLGAFGLSIERRSGAAE